MRVVTKVIEEFEVSCDQCGDLIRDHQHSRIQEISLMWGEQEITLCKDCVVAALRQCYPNLFGQEVPRSCA
jgi:hypothetical protein